MRVAVVGSRGWRDEGRFLMVMDTLYVTYGKDLFIISGMNEPDERMKKLRRLTPDEMAIGYAIAKGLQWKVIRPDYERHPPKIAPLLRNPHIVAEADFVVAFWDGLSGGTANAIAHAVVQKKHIEVYME